MGTGTTEGRWSLGGAAVSGHHARLAGRHVVLYDRGPHIERVLRANGATVTRVESTQAASDVLRSVIPDVFVARADGNESLVELPTIPAERHGEVFALAISPRTAAAIPEQAGYRALLPPEVGPEELIAAVADLAAKSARALRPHRQLRDASSPRQIARPHPPKVQETTLPKPKATEPPSSVAPPRATTGVASNRILDWLGSQAGGLEALGLVSVDLRANDELFAPGERVGWVYFPVSSVLSVSTQLSDGAEVEVMLVGSESAYAGGGSGQRRMALHRVSILIGGRALRMRTTELDGRADDDLRRALDWISSTAMLYAAQRCACAAKHSVAQRVATWLCFARDARGADLPVTHETIARALGVRRAGVTVCIGEFQGEGLVECSRGHIRLLDPGLERRACECYGAVRTESELLWSRIFASART